ncbi:P-loop ATPase, Sll1717 family [Phaeospirillum tilakii]|uniref:P-loop ATPase, Sll1717 family n=1 Tax=Phaeospirillum tilakii TaxID=741673 RepID=A0ABW5CDN1_9PROT
MNFKDIRFGYASAETEGARDPQLLKEGYFDLNGASDQALNGQKFLFLGYKGSGKSAIGERIRITCEPKYNFFVKQVVLADFPFSLFSKIIRGDSDPEAKYPTAWSWILLIYLLESFAKDEGASHHNPHSLPEVVNALGKMGLCPAKDASSIVRISSKANFKLTIPSVFEGSFGIGDLRPASEIPSFVESLKILACGVKTNNRHYVVIDGLDDILTKKGTQYTSIGYLIYEVDRLNNMLYAHNVPAKIILLCRTDIFERVDGANKNKVRQDSSVDINWYHDTRKPENSALISAANLRARVSLCQDVDIFRDFITSNIDGQDQRTYLLDMTRHTPRDFLQLLKCIQDFSEPHKKISSDCVKGGMRKYSIEYFLPEIRDELVGYTNPEEGDAIFDIISAIKKRDFTYEEAVTVANKVAPDMAEKRVYAVFKAMFECGAIGNVQHTPGGTTHFTFKYRNRQSVFKKNERLILHKELWKALNLI